jgi:GR25 family glycosyltransferase involved in LPS biosynthesis
MDVQRIPALIIQTPNLDRFRPLFEILRTSELLDPILLTATMGDSLVVSNTEADEEEQSKYGRTLSKNERACAISHSHARKIIAASSRGGIIFEDDARITDLTCLEESVLTFLAKNLHSSSALGLLDYSVRLETNPRRNYQIKFHRLLAETPLAVATALTPAAAKAMLYSAASSSQTADWPKSKCKFFVMANGCVLHGDSTSGTTIGDPSLRVTGSNLNPFSLVGFKSSIHRTKQKLDTLIIAHRQSK